MATTMASLSACFISAPSNRLPAPLKTRSSTPPSPTRVSRKLRMKPSPLRVTAMAVHRVKLIGPDGQENELEVADDVYILDAAEEAGLELPYSCRAGSCSTCAGLMVSGSVDQSEGTFLDDEQMNKGYVLTCVSKPTSDCVIHTHKEDELH